MNESIFVWAVYVVIYGTLLGYGLYLAIRSARLR